MNLSDTVIELDHTICGNFESSSSREWLETNGIGGYASSSVSGANTRRYHGLLVAATNPPLGRMLLLSKFEETHIIDGERYELSTNQYPGQIHPEGYKHITDFRLDPFPRWTFEINGVKIEQVIFMIHGENSTVCRWTIKGKTTKRCALEVRPLVAFRDHHHLRHEDQNFDASYRSKKRVVSMQPYPEMPRLVLSHNAVEIEPQGHWYRSFDYAIERERGFDHREDLFQPFSLSFDLSKDAVVIASTKSKQVADAKALEKAEAKRRSKLIKRAGATDAFSGQLVLAADQFIVERGDGKTIIAGYPWFSDWGRDTMIALNGLTLATDRPKIAKSILLEFSKHISEGMLPNRFPDAGETPDYNTVDATLWFFEAIRSYVEKTDDIKTVDAGLYDKLAHIIDWHVRGTRYQIHVDDDGLLYAGEAGVQLTWMDAKIGDQVITPRTGKPVEIQALWYNALCIMADFANDPADQAKYAEMAAKAKASFNRLFWNDDEQCLFDVVNGEDKDASIRPNQIFAVSLPNSMLSLVKSRKVVDRVEAELLTPYGLRSLSPNDPRYVPVYTGTPYERDAAYHQGTVWAWPIGAFLDAYGKVHSKSAAAQKLDEVAAHFRSHLLEATLGQVSEIFDGDPPHTPRGCGAQAWSVAEILRHLSQPIS